MEEANVRRAILWNLYVQEPDHSRRTWRKVLRLRTPSTDNAESSKKFTPQNVRAAFIRVTKDSPPRVPRPSAERYGTRGTTRFRATL